ncbi:MAG TPA: nucleotidyltransferase domain-containing protein [Candidatus Paceibacterota bacterium]|jgi:predicted nucleotidyltransferase|nr:nucleotidyltransferase domain-containing protein [Candidatus Paceibacterota bacterium]HRZ29518.1 nucleotidyltransferase domain-containing protein [Candidatus Paceibacterota bacterium]
MNISLRSRITQKILNFLFIHKNDSFYISELSKLINEDRANTYRQLLKLTEEGIINSGYQGQQRYFSINNSYRFLNEYKKIINQTFGLDSILKDKLSSISGIEKAFIFGSYAKNKLNSDSDLDLLVVGNYDIKKLAKILAELQKE